LETEHKGEKMISMTSLKKSMKRLKIKKAKFDKYNCELCYAHVEV
jgi:hypothetical protein